VISPPYTGNFPTYPYKDNFGQIEALLTSSTGLSIYENSFGDPQTASYSTESWNASSTRSTGPPTYYQAYPQPLGSVPNHPSSSSLPPMPFNEMLGQQHRGVPRQRNHRKTLRSNVSHSQESRKPSAPPMPGFKQFLEAQNHLDLYLKGTAGLSDT
jgi:hypothetical protein